MMKDIQMEYSVTVTLNRQKEKEKGRGRTPVYITTLLWYSASKFGDENFIV